MSSVKESHDKIANRLALILTKFNGGERFTVDDLVVEFNVNKRTIQRDLNERLQFLPLVREHDYYFLDSYALGKLNFEDIKNFAVISGIKSLYPSLSNGFITDILNSKINKAYLVRNQSFESLQHKTDEFENVSAAILNHSCIKLHYNEKQREVNPYKLVSNNGIWYLAADEDGVLKTYTFNKISNLKVLEDKKFVPNNEFVKMIDKNEINWFSQTTIEVTLAIDNSAKEYFLRKGTLANKKIIEQTEDKLILSTKVSYDDEIINIVKYWLPYIKIISPSYLQEKLNNTLQEYLKTT